MPTRAALLTGQSPQQLGVAVGGNTGVFVPGGNLNPCLVPINMNLCIPPEEVTIPEALKANSNQARQYISCIVGKWHLSDFVEYGKTNGVFNDQDPRFGTLNYPSLLAYQPSTPGYGFDYSVGTFAVIGVTRNKYWERFTTTGGTYNYYDPFTIAGMAGKQDLYQENNDHIETLWGDPKSGLGNDDEYITDSLTIKAKDFLGTWNRRYHQNSNERMRRPFVLFLHHAAPHGPLQGKEGRTPREIYASMLKSLDESVGEIRELLKPPSENPNGLGIADNTIIIFTSDNGGDTAFSSNGPLKGDKNTPYEGGLRVPLLVYWPGVTEHEAGQPPKVCNEPVTSVDFFPTMVQMAYGRWNPSDYPKVEGTSLVGLIKGTNSTLNRPIFAGNFQWSPAIPQAPNAVVYKKIGDTDYKMIRYYASNDGSNWPGKTGTWTDFFNPDTLALKPDCPGQWTELFKLSTVDPNFGEHHPLDPSSSDFRTTKPILDADLNAWLTRVNAHMPGFAAVRFGENDAFEGGFSSIEGALYYGYPDSDNNFIPDSHYTHRIVVAPGFTCSRAYIRHSTILDSTIGRE